MNLDRIKPETLAAAALDLTPSQSLAAHEYSEQLNAALARLGLTDRLTLPPAPNTAIDELPAVVDVPLRKTLSVLMGKAQQGDASALATLEWTAQVAESIFAGLHARDFAGDRPLALPSHESLATLSQGVDALLPRKISNGAWSLLADGTPSDGIDDGVSLVRLLCSDAADSVTELKDDNEGWVMTKALPSLPNLEKVQLNCVEMNNTRIVAPTTITHLSMPFLKKAIYDTSIVSYQNQGFVQDLSCESVEFPSLVYVYVNGYGTFLSRFNQLKVARFPMLKSFEMLWQGGIVAECALVEEIYMPVFDRFITSADGRNKLVIDCPQLRKVVLGANVMTNKEYKTFVGCPNLSHLEILNEVKESMFLSSWNPTTALAERLPEFLSNFKTYIAKRLSEQGSGLTLTLSKEVYDVISADNEIITIIHNKGWNIAQA